MPMLAHSEFAGSPAAAVDDPEHLAAAHRSADRSLLYPSLAKSVVGGLFAIAVILSGIVAINLLQRDDDPVGTVPSARRSASAKSSAASATSEEAPASPPASPKPSATAKASATPAPAAKPAAKPSASAPVASAPTKEQAARLRIPLTVLNNSRIGGLATSAAADFRAAGWNVAAIDNTTYRPRMTTVYYLPGQEASARQLMRDVPRVRRMLLRPRSLPGGGLTVVVTREYVGQ